MREVFISHSARGDAFAEDVLKAVVAGLEAKGHVPRVDGNDILPGVSWRHELASWLSRCGAAVVLLNESALKSNWVRREVIRLMWRRQLGAALFVVPVLVGKVNSKDVREAGLEELNPLQFVRTPHGAEPSADDLAQRVVKRFVDISAAVAAEDSGDPMRRWLRRVESYLPKESHYAELVGTAAQELSGEAYRSSSGETDRNFVDPHGAHLFMAHEFLMADPDRAYDAVCTISTALGGENLSRLCTELSGTWVDVEAARGLLPEPGTTPQEMTLLLNAGQDRTARRYIRRATCGDLSAYSAVHDRGMPTGEGAAEEMKVDLVASMWRDGLDLEPPSGPSKGPVHRKSTFYLVINRLCPPSRALAEAVRLLHNDHSWLILVLTTGSAHLEEETTQVFNNAAVLSPQLASVDEDRGLAHDARLRTLRPRLIDSD